MDAWKKRRIVRLAIVAMGGLAVGSLMIGVGEPTSATLTAAQATSLSAMGNLSGTVTSPKPFKAAQVYLRNVDKRIMYMVYTNAGQFRSVALFPGNYEISVKANGLQADVQKLVVKAGDNPKISLSLRDAASGAAEADTLANLETLANNRVKVSFDGYDNIYPPGAGRDVAERTSDFRWDRGAARSPRLRHGPRALRPRRASCASAPHHTCT